MIITDGSIYCIHRSQDESRLKSLSKELKSVDLTPTIIEPEPVNESFTQIGRFNKQMNSLRETTINLIKKAKENKDPFVTIIEDDCKFDKKAFELFMNESLPNKFDFIHLTITGNEYFGMSVENRVFRRLDQGLGCVFYIVNNAIYDTYIKLLEASLIPIDKVTQYLHRARGNSFVVDPMPVYHEKGLHSTLNDKIVKY